MNTEYFEKLLSASQRKMIIASILVLAVGLLFIAANLFGTPKTWYWITGLTLFIIGVAMLIVAIRGLSRIRSGEFPLLKAIREKEDDYAIWIYENQIVQKVEGVKAGQSSNIVIYNKHGKQEQIVLGRKAPVSEVISFLIASFPNAYIGYSDDTREAVSKMIGKKV